jgi:hypothetical protein
MKAKAQRFEPKGYTPQDGEKVIAVVVEWERPERPRLVWNPPHDGKAGFYGELMDEIHIPDDIRKRSQQEAPDNDVSATQHIPGMRNCVW